MRLKVHRGVSLTKLQATRASGFRLWTPEASISQLCQPSPVYCKTNTFLQIQHLRIQDLVVLEDGIAGASMFLQWQSMKDHGENSAIAEYTA